MGNNFEQISKVSGFMKHNGGLLFRDISETEFEFKSTIQKIHLNRRDITHGGFICSLIDAGAGTAVYRASNNQSCVTVSLDVKFIAPSRLGDEIVGNDVSGLLAIKSSWPGQMRTVYGDHQRFIETYFSQFPGYYFTGDGAKRDKDGYYWITGRVDDVLNVSGHRIGTAEVEGAIG